ncbi:unnamed protein product [Spirodela intermedia]|uniref:LysM domain-containing protein n=1 Tax=Spirodela intermedia TaxID=51605 RepID=A0A7I8JUW3_SPIIN|nr:unnamed protein product [Spirodela intermedia]CAA6673403.1 unnamed protein product [Spirodela intermedia]
MGIDRSTGNGSSLLSSPDRVVDGGTMPTREGDGLASPSASSTSSFSSSSSISSASGLNFIEHRVSKMDTLAGVAIKYGVEVADIKRMNGLVTDIQMFAHRSLHIPLPGRHPPSPIVSNGSSSDPQQQRHRDLLKSFQTLSARPPQRRVSPAMRTLQGFYGLTPPRRAHPATGRETEMCVVNTPEGSSTGEKRRRRRRQSAAATGSQGAWSTASRWKMEGRANPGSCEEATEERGGGAGAAAEGGLRGALPGGRTGKGLALRQKAGGRPDFDFSAAGTAPSWGQLSVRKSSSASNLQDPDGSSGSAARWPPSRWSQRPDGRAKPSLDGLSRPPMAVWRNKAALD